MSIDIRNAMHHIESGGRAFTSKPITESGLLSRVLGVSDRKHGETVRENQL